MKITNAKALLGVTLGLATAGTANAAEVMVGNPNAGTQVADIISVSTTWTANNTYNLQDQIFVAPGATLTIEAGVVIASDTDVGGSLAITSGAMIFANGTPENPIIFTSTADVDTWDPLPSHPTGKDPTTGEWRVAATEWGNLTIMGEGFISENATVGNVAECDADNRATMEGLVAGGNVPVAFVQYGGSTVNDDSGSVSYVSLRYGGEVLALTVELNGLSLGGIGRNTDIDHIDIMNNVDDGIEIWGGNANLKYVNIWNIGDDSVDVDQGYRGKMQFGLIVQGYSLNAAQGSGVGDNCFETDGAEDSNWQPVTTATLYNFTAIGQPGGTGGDHGTAWRDNARVQYRNCIFMDLGERLVSFDNLDGDGAQGYGFGGTLSWADTWTTDYTYSHSNHPPLNECTNNPQTQYAAQSAGNAAIDQGFLAEITDSVFFRNLGAQAYTESNARGVTVGGDDAPDKGNVVSGSIPITALTRGPAVNPSGTLSISPVISLDPRAAGDAVNSIAAAPNDGFFSQAQYRGAFSTTENWLCGWTAADAFGFNTGCDGTLCPADIDGSGAVDVDDLVAVILGWGPCGKSCPADIDDSGAVDVDDLVAVILGWGPCS